MSKKTFILIILFFPLTTFAQSDGIPLQKDVFLEYPITTIYKDLPISSSSSDSSLNSYSPESRVDPFMGVEKAVIYYLTTNSIIISG